MPFYPRLSIPQALLSIALVVLPAQAQAVRMCQSPDALVVDNSHSKDGLVKSIGVLDTRLHLYIYVPPTTSEWTLGIFDQPDDTTVGKASEFVLSAPDGTIVQTLDKPQKAAWSDYSIATQGRWGIWRLDVLGPEDGSEKGAKARNAFMVRTQGEVDLYLKPESVARVRGLRLGAPQFGGEATHRFMLQSTGTERVRFSLLRPRSTAGATDALKLDWTGAKKTEEPLVGDDRLAKDLSFGTIDYSAPSSPQAGLLPLEIEKVQGTYGLGIEQESRLFFNAKPLMPSPRPVRVQTVDDNGKGIAARFDVTSPQTANENDNFYSSSRGEGNFWVIPSVQYSISATRDDEFEIAQATLPVTDSEVRLVLKRRSLAMKGWYAGDTHCHTAFYDGTDSPAQMIEAGKAAGLDWMAVTEHAHSPQTTRPDRANAEAIPGAEAGFVVIPGMEYTGPRFHANVFGKVIAVEAGAGLQQVLDAAKAASTEEAPVVAQLNHPTLGKTARQEALDVTGLGMMELWNSEEPEATDLWWSLLNKGQRVVADTGSDSHNRKNLAVGSRRVYVYLGDKALTAPNILRALREGRSFISRGAQLDVTLGEERPGGTVKATPNTPLEMKLTIQSARPLERVDIIANGAVVQSFDLKGETRWQSTAPLATKAGWVLAQVWQRGDKMPVAMSNPIWVEGK